MRRAGLEVTRVRLGAYLRPSDRHMLAVRAICPTRTRLGVLCPPGTAETRQFLNPGLLNAYGDMR
jgi:hypothetical protein